MNVYTREISETIKRTLIRWVEDLHCEFTPLATGIKWMQISYFNTSLKSENRNTT